MGFVILLIAIIVLGVCLTEGKGKAGFLGVVAAILYFPIGVILALAKKYK